MAEVEGIRLVGSADAEVLAAQGVREAEALVHLGDAFKQYTGAASLAAMLETLPKLAAEVSAPLARVKEILITSGGNAGDNNNEVGELIQEVLGALGLSSQVPVEVGFRFSLF